MSLRFEARTLLTVFLMVVFSYVVIEAWDMPLQAKLFPFTIGAIALTLLVYQFIKEVFVPPKQGATEHSGADMDFTEDESTTAGKKRALELFGWVYGFGIGLWLVGFYVAIPLMIFLYLLRHREGPVIVVALPLGMWLATWGIFDRLLHLPFPPGLLVEMVGIR